VDSGSMDGWSFWGRVSNLGEALKASKVTIDSAIKTLRQAQSHFSETKTSNHMMRNLCVVDAIIAIQRGLHMSPRDEVTIKLNDLQDDYLRLLSVAGRRNDKKWRQWLPFKVISVCGSEP